MDPSSGFPPPPSPTTLRRSIPSSTNSIVDPRLDVNFSAVIAQRAAECKARRHENLFPFEYNSTGLPPATTFFNNCVTTNRVQQPLPNHSKNIVSSHSTEILSTEKLNQNPSFLPGIR